MGSFFRQLTEAVIRLWQWRLVSPGPDHLLARARTRPITGSDETYIHYRSNAGRGGIDEPFLPAYVS